jgi:hypothetical protein
VKNQFIAGETGFKNIPPQVNSGVIVNLREAGSK